MRHKNGWEEASTFALIMVVCTAGHVPFPPQQDNCPCCGLSPAQWPRACTSSSNQLCPQLPRPDGSECLKFPVTGSPLFGGLMAYCPGNLPVTPGWNCTGIIDWNMGYLPFKCCQTWCGNGCCGPDEACGQSTSDGSNCCLQKAASVEEQSFGQCCLWRTGVNCTSASRQSCCLPRLDATVKLSDVCQTDVGKCPKPTQQSSHATVWIIFLVAALWIVSIVAILALL